MSSPDEATADKKRKAKDNDDKYVVVTTRYPTSYGCHHGREWTTAELIWRSDVQASKESYDTKEEAIEAARKVRDDECEFQDCEEIIDEDDLPPWDSSIMANYDNDEEVIIDVMTRAEYQAQVEENQRYLNNARFEKQFESKVERGVLAEKAKAIGRVFYSFPPQPYDIPAELEMDDSSDRQEILKKDLGSLKSLRFAGGKLWKASIDFWNESEDTEQDPKKAPPDLLLETLARCSNLEELHLKLTDSFQTELSSGYIDKILEVAPHLSETLKVLSTPMIHISPDGLKSIASFSQLEQLDIWESMTTEHWEDDNDDMNGFGSTEVLPYDNALEECILNLPKLERLDLGNGDYESQRYLHDYSLSREALSNVRDEMREHKGVVTMTERRTPPDYPVHARAAMMAAARSRVLLALSQNQEEGPEIRQLATDALRTCQTCNKKDCKLACSKCKSHFYCSETCQKKDWKKKHKKACVQV